ETYKAKATLKNFSGTTDVVEKSIPKTFGFQGVTFEEVPGSVKDQLDLNGGVLISSVSGEKWGKAGARPGFIITSIITESGRAKISDVENLLEVLEATDGESIVVLGMFQDGTEYYFEVD